MILLKHRMVNVTYVMITYPCTYFDCHLLVNNMITNLYLIKSNETNKRKIFLNCYIGRTAKRYRNNKFQALRLNKKKE